MLAYGLSEGLGMVKNGHRCGGNLLGSLLIMEKRA